MYDQALSGNELVVSASTSCELISPNCTWLLAPLFPTSRKYPTSSLQSCLAMIGLKELAVVLGETHAESVKEVEASVSAGPLPMLISGWYVADIGRRRQ